MARVYVALGGNIDPAARLPQAARLLRARFPGLECSSAWRNAAEGFAGDDFYNAVATFETPLGVGELRAVLHAIEEQCGRLRDDAKWAPRAMDIDLLLHGDYVGASAAGELPRPDLLRRAYMLGPLAELAPGLRHPVAQRTIGELWAERLQRGPPHLLQRLPLDLQAASAG
jgi:2-amino-4-hydroxy-6-hydroxymethyldihydropteridine diphosphokinase